MAAGLKKRKAKRERQIGLKIEGLIAQPVRAHA